MKLKDEEFMQIAKDLDKISLILAFGDKAQIKKALKHRAQINKAFINDSKSRNLPEMTDNELLDALFD